jgi:hypothetical protein
MLNAAGLHRMLNIELMNDFRTGVIDEIARITPSKNKQYAYSTTLN